MADFMGSHRSDINDGFVAGAGDARDAQHARGDGADGAPRLVIRGESNGELGTPWFNSDGATGERFLLIPDSKGGAVRISLPSAAVGPYTAITDWLNCSFRYDANDGPPAFAFRAIWDALPRQFRPLVDRHKGLHVYKNSFALGESGAMFAFGGQRNTGFLSLPGAACQCIENWTSLTTLLKALPRARITRWDGAVDDYLGQHSVDDAVTLWKAGAFGTGGNQPKPYVHGDWLEPHGAGRTLEIGSRSNGKMLRVYEKGMQLGVRWHPWVRWELELHNIDRVIPWDVLTNPGGFFVGGYPKALKWVEQPMCRIETVRRAMSANYESLIASAKLSYGQVFTAVREIEGSDEAAFRVLSRPGIPKRLNHPVLGSEEGTA